MKLQDYLKKRALLQEQGKKYREICLTCRQPHFRCYCDQVRKFDPSIKFVILIHPLEVKRAIATGRLSYLCLEDSELILGCDYSDNERVTAIVENKNYHSVVLYPGKSATNITPLTTQDRKKLFPADKKLVIFVIDGTWNTARKTVRLSKNLSHLPQIFFSPPQASRFRVRTQPNPDCYSTVEAIHHTIELLGSRPSFNIDSRDHDILLSVFDHMVEKQLSYVRPGHTRHRKKQLFFENMGKQL